MIRCVILRYDNLIVLEKYDNWISKGTWSVNRKWRFINELCPDFSEEEYKNVKNSEK